IEQHAVARPAGTMQRVDQHAFVVALETFDLDLELGGESPDAPVDVLQRGVTVDLRLTSPEGVEVRTVKDKDAMHHASAPAWSRALRTRRPEINRGTLAWPTRGVNTQRTPRALRFLSRRMAASSVASRVRGMRAGSPSASSSASCRARAASPRPASVTDK